MPARKSSTPPPVMSWSKATPVLILCGIFDVIRLMCEQLWLFGPLLVGAVGTVASGSGVIGAAAGIIAGGAEFLTGPTLEIFGVVMAMATGLLGWATAGVLLIMFNPRIFKADSSNVLWMLVCLIITEMPLVGTLPALTVTVWRAHKVQIEKEQADLKKYQEEEATQSKREQRRSLAEQYAALGFRKMQEMKAGLEKEQADEVATEQIAQQEEAKAIPENVPQEA